MTTLSALPVVNLHLAILFFSMITSQLQQSHAAGNDTDRLALLEFKQAITTDSHGVFNSWNHSFHFCNWFGVSCGRRHQRVVSLVLNGHNLKGSVSPYIGNLSFLRTLDLQNNSFHGRIPSEIGNLFRLELFLLNNNSLRGEIPSSLSNCSKLQKISLRLNNLSGKIPGELGSLTNLESLSLVGNNLTGEIPASLANLSSLVSFNVQQNNLSGNVPDGLGGLTKLYLFSVGFNHLSGIIPPSLFNISSLEYISLLGNQFQGDLPDNISLPNILEITISGNNFSGSIPSSLSNASRLEVIDISENNFVGHVPRTLGNLYNLWWLDLSNNDLVSNSTDGWSFLASLTNCSSLTLVDLNRNRFSGVLPNFIGNLSTQLSELYLGGNQISGTIPTTLENLTNLTGLFLEDNFLVGTIPAHLGKLQKLQELSFRGNRLSGLIPSSIGNLTNLFLLDLKNNKLEGSIPAGITNSKRLQQLYISNNFLNGTIPLEFLRFLSSLIVLDLSRNSFTGNLPEEIGELTNINGVDVSDNRLSGEIPRSIGECLSLEYLYMQGNSFQGEIPSSFYSLRGLQELDLSRNNLTGEIPQDLHNLSFLSYLNLSFNHLEGEVPTRGIFRNLSLFSLVGNEKLCDGLLQLRLPKCPQKSKQKEKHRARNLAVIVASVVLFLVSLSASLLIYYLKKQRKSNPVAPFLSTGPHLEVSYRDLHQATSGFSSDHLIGSGSFGFVYKGYLDKEKISVAIKVLKLEETGALKSFMAECKALRSVRHRNLVKLLTYCLSLDYKGNEFKALIFEFMENGSLEKWLDHDNEVNNQGRNLNFLQRLNIAIDIASALHYLHDLCETLIIHRDLKPSNILLDDNFVARLSDFGLAKLFFSINDESQSQMSSIGVKGTIGYAPPEYGMGGMASKEGDVYSFGILVLELFSGKKPIDQMFENGLNLHGFVKNGMSQAVWTVVDPTILSEETEEAQNRRNRNPGRAGSDKKECLLSVFRIGVECSMENPKERMKMGDVVKELHLIRSAFLGVRIYG